jgi:hypothetical protein
MESNDGRAKENLERQGERTESGLRDQKSLVQRGEKVGLVTQQRGERR